MKPEVGKPNPSQYPGTLKNTICKNCTKVLNGMSREKQDEHERNCLKQTKLF